MNIVLLERFPHIFDLLGSRRYISFVVSTKIANRFLLGRLNLEFIRVNLFDIFGIFLVAAVVLLVGFGVGL